MSSLNDPPDERYHVLAYYPNTTIKPQKIQMRDLDAAFDVCRALSHDGMFAWVTVLDSMNNIERMKIYVWDLYDNAARH